MFHPTIVRAAESILNDPCCSVSYDEACDLAMLSEAHPVDFFSCADKIRAKYKGNRVFTCAIVNAKSGFCTEDCAFCAQSASHATQIHTYPLMTEEELFRTALRVFEAGASKYSMVTSGYALNGEEIGRVCRTAMAVTGQTTLSVCASLGMLSDATARQLKAAGVTRYHHNIETARSHFSEICTTHDYDDDLNTVKMAKSVGLEVCSGCIMGLGETWEQRVELAFTLRELDVDSIPVNFLNPIPGTRMEGRPCSVRWKP